jgi:hypothetical protein
MLFALLLLLIMWLVLSQVHPAFQSAIAGGDQLEDARNNTPRLQSPGVRKDRFADKLS